MTIEQRVERMFNPGGSTPVGTGFPLVPFASLPAASTVEGQVRRLTELPHVSLIALGGIWRPFGGRQVLASRSINPVTVQSLTSEGTLAETIGPFPGGLVRAGMRLEMEQLVGNSGIGTGARVAFWFIGNNTKIAQANDATSGANLVARVAYVLLVKNDSNAAHISSGSISGGFANSITPAFPVVDFSAPWSTIVKLQSSEETAVNIASATWVGGVATYNTSAAHTLAVGDKTTIAGVSLAGYNGVFIVASVVDTDTFTVAMPANPGGSGTGGTSSRISNMISQSYVLELVG